MNDEYFMREALSLARSAECLGEVPVGALVVLDGKVVGRGFNSPIGENDPTAHAEIAALRDAARHLENYRLPGCELFVTLEPCAMCAGAIAHARLRRLYFGAEDVKAGAVENGIRLFEQPTCHHAPEVIGGIGERQAAAMLKDFFAAKRG